MTPDDCFELGYIVKAHGLKGQVLLHLDVDDPSRYYQMESVLLQKADQLIPFFISNLLPQGNRLLVSFLDINDRDEASSLIGSKMFLPLQLLESIAADEYYYHELVGMEVHSDTEHIGIIKAIYQPSSQYLAAVDYRNHEVLIPITDDIFLSVDKEKRLVKVELPDGLLDIYSTD